jgi:hypothetical protein
MSAANTPADAANANAVDAASAAERCNFFMTELREKTRKGLKDPQNETISDKFIAIVFFTLTVASFLKYSNGDGEWACICGNKRKKGNGYGNLSGHVKTDHENYLVIVRKWMTDGILPTVMSLKEAAKSALSYPSVTSLLPNKSINIHGWIDWVVSGLKPFAFVEEEETRKYSKLKPICSETLVKYMNLLCRQVEIEIARILPPTFAIIFDAWTCNSYHFVATFASFCSVDGVVQLILLGFTVMTLSHTGYDEGEENLDGLEMKFDSLTFINLFKEQLSFYEKTLENISVLIGDNCSVNRKISQLMQKPFVGCASHRLNLAANLFLKPYQKLLDKIEALMVRLRTLKKAAILREKTSLKPKLLCATRWSGVFCMIERYLKLYEFLDQLDPDLIDLHLSSHEYLFVKDTLFPNLKKINSVTKALQKKDITLSRSRILLDGLLSDFPELKEKISPTASIVQNPHFESAICKVQNQQRASSIF